MKNKELTIEEDFSLACQYHKEKKFKDAENLYKKILDIDSNHLKSIFLLGSLQIQTKNFKSSVETLTKVIQIHPNHKIALNYLGIAFYKLGKHKKAIEYYKKGIKIDPNNSDAYWNLHSHASNIDEALNILKKLYKIDNTSTNSKIMISALNAYKGNFNDFNDLMKSTNSNNPMTRSVNWVLSLPKIPKIFFNRWDFFNAIITLADQSRPFYEFGVWNGISFKYLINTFKKGFGFDTFCGLPEDWHNEPSGTYSSLGSIPKIKGGEFIVGKFEDTLPKFFSQKDP